jgi:hypothetical protein
MLTVTFGSVGRQTPLTLRRSGSSPVSPTVVGQTQQHEDGQPPSLPAVGVMRMSLTFNKSV